MLLAPLSPPKRATLVNVPRGGLRRTGDPRGRGSGGGELLTLVWHRSRAGWGGDSGSLEQRHTPVRTRGDRRRRSTCATQPVLACPTGTVILARSGRIGFGVEMWEIARYGALWYMRHYELRGCARYYELRWYRNTCSSTS